MSDALDTDKTTLPSDVHPPSSQLSPGTTLGQYRIIKLLGRGGMGEVYEVEHTTLGRRYALKVLPAGFANRAGALERFRREARVMANLEHPNIIRVDDFGETDGRYWLRMEVAGGVDGSEERRGRRIVSLQDYAEALGGKVPQEELLEILKQIVAGLSYAHERGAVHRDLKPSNILLAQTMKSDGARAKSAFDDIEVKISDFGLVRLVGEDWVRSQAQISLQQSMSMGDGKTMGDSEGTSTRSMLGTYEYMSPEQKLGDEADARSDIYSLGLMTFKLLTGQELSRKALTKIDPVLVPVWDKLCDESLEPNREERLRNCTAFLDYLDDVSSEISSLHRNADEECQRLAETERRSMEAEAAALQREAEDREAALRERERRAREAQGRRAEAEQAYARAKSERPPPRPKPERSKRTKRGLGRLLVILPVLVFAAAGYLLWQSDLVAPRIRKSGFDAASPELSRRSVATRRSAVRTAPGRHPATGRGWVSTGSGMEFVWVEALKMWVGKYEVTNGEYRKKETGHNSQSHEGYSLDGDRQPVVQVNFDDAMAYAKWLTRKDQAAGELTAGYRYRLPSDTEWMAFAQCGDGREYPWGDNWPPKNGQAGNYDDETAFESGRVEGGYRDGHPVTSDVGESWANPWGLYGVGGNVWELAAEDSSGSSFGAWRGASWYDYLQIGLRCSTRVDRFRGSGRRNYIGFRLVLSRR